MRISIWILYPPKTKFNILQRLAIKDDSLISTTRIVTKLVEWLDI